MKPSAALMERMRDLPPEYRDEERLGIFRSLVAPGVPDEVVALVYHYGADLGLDPLRKEVMVIQSKRKNDQGQWVIDYNIIVNVHGIVKLMAREADYCGLRAACVYPGETCIINSDGAVEHTFDAAQRMALAGTEPGKAMPIGAWATVTRLMHGAERRFTQFVPFHQVAGTTDEYMNNQRTGRKQLRSIWAQRPDWMTEKCAIAAVARKAYDHKLGRIYAPEEFGAASDPSGAIEADAELLEPVTTKELPPAERPARVTVEGAPVAGSIAAIIMQHRAEVAHHTAQGHSAQKAETMAMSMRMLELEKLVEETERLFRDESTNTARTFLVKTSSGVWLKDAEALAAMKRPAPVLLDSAGVNTLAEVFHAIEVIRNAKEANGAR